MNRLTTTLACFFALTGLLSGCAMEDAKGVEDNLEFENYDAAKADSFRNPTEHGDLNFGLASSASLTEDHLFHTWTFTLSGDAEVDVPVAIGTANLDTVMYMYRREPGTERWGRYIARNDDSGDSVASRLTDSLGAGEYRVLIKGYKTALRGDFSITPTCDGAGCPGEVDCSADSIPSDPTLPEECTEALSYALNADRVSSDRTSVTLSNRCSLPTAARVGLEAYYNYWDGIAGWEDAFGWLAEDEELEIDVAWSELSSGAFFVEVDAGGDEAAMDYIITAEGELLAGYQHNQSPTFLTFCAGSEDWEDETCGGIYMSSMVHSEVDEMRGTEEGVTLADAESRLPAATYLAFQEFAQENELGDSDEATVYFAEWAADSWDADSIASVTVESSEFGVTSYEISQGERWSYVITEQNGFEGPRNLVCREL